MNNPFTVGQSLIVVFGNPQTFTVAELRKGACAMQFPHSTFMTKWYSVTDLLRWNPAQNMEQKTVIAIPPLQLCLPAPRFELRGYQQQRKVQLADITHGDVLLHYGNRLGMWLVCRIGRAYNVKLNPHEIEMRRWAQLQNIHTGEIQRKLLRWNGGGAETVAGKVLRTEQGRAA